MSPEAQTTTTPRSAWLLALGAALGLALAAWGLLGEAAGSGLPRGTIARVNSTLLREDDFERLVAAVLEDMRTPDEAKARKRVLDRMIEIRFAFAAVPLFLVGVLALDRRTTAGHGSVSPET